MGTIFKLQCSIKRKCKLSPSFRIRDADFETRVTLLLNDGDNKFHFCVNDWFVGMYVCLLVCMYVCMFVCWYVCVCLFVATGAVLYTCTIHDFVQHPQLSYLTAWQCLATKFENAHNYLETYALDVIIIVLLLL